MKMPAKSSKMNPNSLFYLRLMRKTVDVNELLGVFTHRKKSWAYKQLRTARLGGHSGPTLVSELAAHLGYSEHELRESLGRGFVERN